LQIFTNFKTQILFFTLLTHKSIKNRDPEILVFSATLKFTYLLSTRIANG